MTGKVGSLIKYRVLYCIVAAAVLTAICSRSSPFYPLNNSADANCFFTVGKAMMNGVIPYRDIYEQKGPLLYFIYGLGYLLSNTTFLGIYLVETAALSALLLSILLIVELYVENAPWWLPAAAGAVIASSHGFALGGCSVEELSLPLFSWSLYQLLRLLRSGGENARGIVLTNGFFAGCVFWMKFSLTGFYIGWIACVTAAYLTKGGLKQGLQAALIFLTGFLSAALPWIIYFSFNHALRELWTVYFYNNIFSYAVFSKNLAIALQHAALNLWHDLSENLWYAVPAAVGLLWVLTARRCRMTTLEKAGVISSCVLLTAGIYAGGRSYAYYSLPLAVYMVFGLIPLLTVLRRALKPAAFAVKRFLPVCSAAIIILSGVCAFRYSYNTYFFGADKNVMVQYRFGRIMQELDSAPTLLNYGFMDSGFYTASGIVPSVRYFSALNIKGDDIKAAQDGYLLTGSVRFVVTENTGLDLKVFSKYRLICSDVFYSKSYTSTYYLYQLDDPAPA